MAFDNNNNEEDQRITAEQVLDALYQMGAIGRGLLYGAGSVVTSLIKIVTGSHVPEKENPLIPRDQEGK